MVGQAVERGFDALQGTGARFHRAAVEQNDILRVKAAGCHITAAQGGAHDLTQLLHHILGALYACPAGGGNADQRQKQRLAVARLHPAGNTVRGAKFVKAAHNRAGSGFGGQIAHQGAQILVQGGIRLPHLPVGRTGVLRLHLAVQAADLGAALRHKAGFVLTPHILQRQHPL